MPTILRQRRDTAANWSSANPVVPDGQLCFDTTNDTFRIGDGTSNYSSLPVQSGVAGDMSGANNLSEVVSAPTARANLGLVIGTDVQAYDSTIVVDADIGSTVQAFDSTIVVDADIGVNVEAFDGTILKDADVGSTVGYLNIPKSGASKTASYTLVTTDIGELIEVGSSGAITIPDATFSTGDVILIFNNTTGDVTITCSITTAYIGGTNTDESSITLATRGICNVLFISGTVCVVTGNVT